MACCGHKILIRNGSAAELDVFSSICSFASLNEVRAAQKVPTFDP